MRYGVIKRQRKGLERGPDEPLHYLSVGTMVRVVNGPDAYGMHKVQTMYPVHGISALGASYKVKEQVLDLAKDVAIFPQWFAPGTEAAARVFKRSRELLCVGFWSL